jgi:hypothetical protein
MQKKQGSKRTKTHPLLNSQFNKHDERKMRMEMYKEEGDGGVRSEGRSWASRGT